VPVAAVLLLAASLGQQGGNLIRIRVVVLHRALGEELVAASATLLAIGQYIGQAKLAANRPWYMSRELSTVDELTTVGRLNPRISAACCAEISWSRVRMLIDCPWLSAWTTRLRIACSCSVSSTLSCSSAPLRKKTGSGEVP
jgi:hypothetical protein